MADSILIPTPEVPWESLRQKRQVPSMTSVKTKAKGRKLAQIVAEAIEADIVNKGWPLGEALGSEPDLLARFGVSRAVLREAIRIVESHGVAAMRRGPVGGLIVTAPDMRAPLRTSALLLDFQGVSSENLFEARSLVEAAAVERATERLDENGIAVLRETLEVEFAAMESTETSPEKWRGAHDLHSIIASLSGNPALRLFVDVLIEMTQGERGQAKYIETTRDGHDVAEIERDIHRAHAAIVDAMVQGDAAVAVHRMRRHLKAMEPWML